MRKAKRILALLLVFTLMFSNIGTTIIYATDIQNEPAVSQETEASPAVEPAETEPPIAEPSPEPTPAEPVVEEEPVEEAPAATPEEEPPADEPAATVPAPDAQPTEEPMATSIGPADSQEDHYATYEFYYKGELVDTQIIKNSGELREPAVSGQVFQGWLVRGSAEDEYLEFPVQVTAEKTETICVDAVVKEKAYVQFLDQNGEVVEVLSGAAGAEVKVDVRIDLAAGKALKAWQTADGTQYQLDETVALPAAGETLVLTPVVVDAHWVTFDSRGGTAVEPVYVEGAVSVTEPEQPTRPGYEFKGWATTETSSTMFNFGTAITEDIVLYAQWEQNNEVTYTVAYWEQRIGDEVDAATKKYDYAGTDPKSRPATRQNVMQKTPTSGDTAKAKKGFYYSHSKMVEKDGTYVLNVYFNRTEVTFKFYDKKSKPSNGDTPKYTYTGLYGQPLPQWPNKDNNWVQVGNNSSFITYLGEFLVEEIPSGQKTYLVQFYKKDKETTYPVNFYLQKAEGGYEKVADAMRGSSGFTVTDKFDGYSVQWMKRVCSGGWGHWNCENDSELVRVSAGASVSNTDSLDIYFDLALYNFDIYYYGSSEPNKTEPVAFKTSLKDKNPGKLTPAEGYEAYEFTGWYADPGCTTEFDFNQTMPAHDVAIYAGWKIKTVEVKYDVNAKAEEVDNWTFDTVSTPAGNKIVKPSEDPKRDGWVFGGWIDKKTQRLFNFNQPVTEDVVLVAKWIKAGTYTIEYVTEGDATVSDSAKYKDGSKAVVQSGDGLKDAEGNAFLYWVDAKGNRYRSGAVMDVDAAEATNNRITLTAVYALPVFYAKIVYNSNYPIELNMAVQTQDTDWQILNSKFTIEDVPSTWTTPTGYEFTGWNTEANGTGTAYDVGQEARVDSNGKNVLYAQWNFTGYTITYVAGKGGTVARGTQIVAPGTKPENVEATPTDPTEDYFVGWFAKYENGEYSEPVADITAPVTADTTYYAKFAPKTLITLTVEDITYDEVYTGAPIPKTANIKVLMSKGADIEYTLSCDGDVVANQGANDFTISGTEVGSYTGTVTVQVTKCPDEYTYEFAGDKNTAAIVLNITPATVAVDHLTDVVYNGEEQKLEPVVKFGDTTLAEDNYTVTWDTADFTNVGPKTATIELTNRNYTFEGGKTETTVSYAITPIDIEISVERTKTYTGNDIVFDLAEDLTADELKNEKLVEGHTISVEGTVTGRNVNEAGYTETFTGDAITVREGTTPVTGNYNITVNATLKITKTEQDLVITVKKHTKVYDGEPWTMSSGDIAMGVDYEVAGLQPGDTLNITSLTASDAYVDAATYSGVIEVEYELLNDGEDASGNYKAVTVVAGDLEITKRPVTLKSANESFTYDGELHSGVKPVTDVYTVDNTEDGFVGEDGFTAELTKSIRVGSVDNEFTYELTEGTNAENYHITTEYGTLTITPIATPITITAPTSAETYRGFAWYGEKAKVTYTENVLLTGDRLVIDTLSGGGADVGEYPIHVAAYHVERTTADGTPMDVTKGYTFDTVVGKLTVTPYKLTLRGSNTVTFNGKEHSVELKKVGSNNLPSGHTLDAASVTITKKDVGIYVTGEAATGETMVTLTPKINANGKDVTKNFEINLDGRLEITKPNENDYDVSVDKAGWVYDGETGGPVSTTFTNKNTGGGAVGFLSPPKITYQKIVSAGNVEELGTTAPTEAGKYIVCATWVPTAENTNNLPTLTATKEFEIQKRPVTFNKIMETDYQYDPNTYEGISQEFVLDTTEEPLTEAIAAGSFANNRTTASTTAVIKGTNVGEHKLEDAAGKVVITDAGKDVTSNYAITFEPVLRINPVDRPEEKRALEVQSYNKPYDADAHTIDHNFEAIELPDDALEFLGADGQWTTTKRSYTDVTNGEQTVQIRVTNPNFNPVSNAATVRITPFKVRVTAPKVEIEYGQTLPAASELRATIVTQTIPGNPAITSSVSYDMRELGGTKPAAKTYLGVVNVFATAFSENYEFELVSGDVIVRQKGARTIAVTGYEGTYNGQPHSVTVSFPNGDGEPTDKVYYRVAGEEEWTTEELTFTDVVDTTVEVKVVNPNFAVDSTGTARIQISPATLNVETYGATKTYDGSPLTAGGSMTGLVGEETATLRVTGSVTDATGSEGVPNTYEIDWGTAKESNYTIHEDSVGRLIVNRQTIEKGFTVAGVASLTYDGEEHIAAPGVSKTNGDLLEKGTDYTLTYTDDAEKTVTDFTNVTGLIHVTVTGKGNYTGSVTRTYQIIPKQLTVTSESASKVYDGTKLTAPGHVSGFVPGEEVGFTTPELVNVDYSNDDHSIVNEVTIQWNDTTKASNYTYTPDYGTLTVTPRTLDEEGTDFEVSEPRSSVYDGAEHQERLAVTYKNQPLVLGKDYTETYTDARGRVVTNFTDVTGPINVTITGTGNFAGTVRKQYQITPAPLTITTEGGVKVYDGTALTVDGYTVDGLKNNEALDLTITGTQTIAGSSDNTYTIDWNASSAKQGNYAITNELGRLQVEAQSIDPQVPGRYSGVTVSQPDDTVYNGGAQRRSVTVTDANGDALVPGLDYTVTYSDNVTDAGTVTVTVTGIGSYSGTVTRTYRITPKELTVTTASAEKVYDGEALTRTNGYTLSGLVFGENVSMRITGTQTAAGTSDNTYSINWGRVNEQNYTITEELGTLTVTAQSIDPDAEDDEYMGVTVGTLGNVVYNGLTQAVRPRVANAAGRALMSGVDYTITFSADTTNVGEVIATVTGIGNYAGTVTRTYRITPAPLTVNTESATIVFNGGALTAGGRVTGLVNGETVTLNTTGSQTFVGSSENTYEIVWDNARRSNYEIVSETLGTLTVLAAPAVPDAPAAPAAPDAPAPQAEDDPAPVVAPETDPEPAPEPVPEVEDEPVEIEENSVPLAPNTEPEVETIDDNATPLAPGAETHECCILHFLLLLLALCVEIYYTHDRKKRQKHIYELRSEIGSEE